MEGLNIKRRKLQQEECATWGCAANDRNAEADQLSGPLQESTSLVAHSHDVCFGMIKIEIKSLRPDALGANGEIFIEISLNLDGDQLVARNMTTREYGGLFAGQHRTTIILRGLSERHCATLRAWLIRNDNPTQSKPVYELYVVIYGMISQEDIIGDLLDRAELFLQDPPDAIRGGHSVPYFNPHRLHNPTLSGGINQSFEEPFSTPVKMVLRDGNPLKQQIQEVMDSACGPQSFVGSQQSPRIRTRLKHHQMQALSMMIEKENGNISNNLFGSVWKVMEQCDGIKFKNTVTGSVQPDFPRLCYGGILADDMGLGKTLTTISLIAASKDFAESGANNPPSHRTTLIVTPLSLLQTWEEQLSNHVHCGQLSYCKYYGASKGDVSSLVNYDIVLTTYDTVSNDASKNARDAVAGLGIGSVEWLRVILDEAHVVRNRSTRRFGAIHALKARFRWCLTGTPIFNRVEDLGSLMGFLGAHPFDSSSTFSYWIANPVAKGEPKSLEALRKLVQATSLRRTKNLIRDELLLPGRMVVEEVVEFTTEEQRDYDVLKSRYGSILHEDEKDTTRRSTASIMQTIARLRQFCDHGLHLLPDKVHQLFDAPTTAETFSWSLFDALEVCAVCQSSVNEDSQSQYCLECGHYLCIQCQRRISDEETVVDIMCKLCDRDSAKSDPNSPCPKTSFTTDTSNYVPSSKVRALIRNLMSDRQNSPYQPIKSVVFSCWNKMIDLIQKALIAQGLDFVRIDGSKSEKARREAISRFRREQNCGILLATIGSAGVGLDLTVASRVHIIEPQWAQMAENQAVDRVHRLGQTQDVIATRYIVKDSIEEYVVMIQNRKAAVMHQAFETDGVENVLSARERLLQYLA